jgi:2-methylisocitrate lyase-like PEP mutase family enzyme
MTASALRTRLSAPGLLRLPGVFDPLSALLAEKAGFDGVFLSGSALAYAGLGRPDVGLVTMTEVADACMRVTDRVALPVLVDADSGHGNAANVARTVRLLERSGAAAIQIEDQWDKKPVAALASRPLISTAEMVGKIKAALDARDAALISARTDAALTTSVDDALERVAAYIAAGADIVFAEGLKSETDMARLIAAAGATPVLHNALDGGPGAASDAAGLAALGYRLVLYPGVAIGAAAAAMRDALAGLAASGSAQSSLDAKGLNALIGTPEFLANAARYAGD